MISDIGKMPGGYHPTIDGAVVTMKEELDGTNGNMRFVCTFPRTEETHVQYLIEWISGISETPVFRQTIPKNANTATLDLAKIDKSKIKSTVRKSILWFMVCFPNFCFETF